MNGPHAEYEPDPEIREDGLPLCREECVHYDGKRCRMLGFRPDRICEPAVLRMAERMKRADMAGVE